MDCQLKNELFLRLPLPSRNGEVSVDEFMSGLWGSYKHINYDEVVPDTGLAGYRISGKLNRIPDIQKAGYPVQP